MMVSTGSLQSRPCCSEKEWVFFFPQQFLIVVAVTTSTDGLAHRKISKEIKTSQVVERGNCH